MFVAWACRSAPRDVFYTPPGTRTEFYKQAPVPLRMTIYPESVEPNETHKGAVLFIHGGGWRTGGSDLPLFHDWESGLARASLRAFSIEHRLAPQYRGTAQVDDCAAAVEYLRIHAERLRIPPDKIALIGFSSGGHLAVLTALRLSQVGSPGRAGSPVQSVVAFYAPLAPQRLAYAGNARIRAILRDYAPEPGGIGIYKFLRKPFATIVPPELSPAAVLHARTPPILLIHGEADRLVPPEQSRAFMERAKTLGLKNVQLKTIPGARHNFNMSRAGWARRAEKTALDFVIQAP